MKTLSQIMNELQAKGYTGNIAVEELNKLNPKEWMIDETHRFEGDTNPEDSSILYGISKKDGSDKTLIVDAYGVDSEKLVSKFIAKLETTK